MSMEKKKNSKLLRFIGCGVLTVLGFIIVPPIITKISNKIYKMNSDTDKIDFDNLGPEIVKRETNEEN